MEVPSYNEYLTEAKKVKFSGIAGTLRIEQDYMISWLPSTMKDMDTWNDLFRQNTEQAIHDLLKSLKLHKQIEVTWLHDHPGAGVWFKIDKDSIAKIIF